MLGTQHFHGCVRLQIVLSEPVRDNWSMITRREILAYGTAVASGLPFQNASTWLPLTKPSPLMIFEKVLQNLSPKELAKTLVEIGADGVEVAIRPGGRIVPAEAEQKIPELVKALNQQDKKIFVATTNITSVTPESKQLLKILADHQIPQYRMGYYRWSKKRNWNQQWLDVEKQIGELADLNRELGITGLYQNHAGNKYYGALVYEMLSILSRIGVDEISLALDLRHLRAEAGLSWSTIAEVAANRIGCIYIKDARWQGPKSQQLENVPLGNGFVDREMFEQVRKRCPAAPISLHVEYHGGKPLQGPALQQAIESFRLDTKKLRHWMTSP